MKAPYNNSHTAAEAQQNDRKPRQKRLQFCSVGGAPGWDVPIAVMQKPFAREHHFWGIGNLSANEL
jgi:hypothetical protein